MAQPDGIRKPSLPGGGLQSGGIRDGLYETQLQVLELDLGSGSRREC